MRPPDELGQTGRVEDAQGGLGVVGQQVALGRGQRGVEEDRDEAGPGGAQHRTYEVGGGAEREGDPVAPPTAPGGQRPGGPALAVLGVGGVEQLHHRRSVGRATMAPMAMEDARALLERSRRVVVLTGAGISTDSGIPDFRGPQGLWTKNPAAEKSATIAAYVADPELRRRAWLNRITSPMWSASEPNPGHHALVDLERSGRLHTLVTQNIDGLHQKAGSDPERVIEIHGTTLEVVCLSCGHRQPAEAVHDRVRARRGRPGLHGRCVRAAS